MSRTKPNWFSIKEAADYLDVGEPTIYRWMREKRLTFRKVGDSTRFLREDLEAMIQIHPAEGDVERATQFCPICHGTELVNGRLRSTGLLYFHPDKTRFWTFHGSNIPVQSRMCTSCGAIFLAGETSGLARLRPSATESADQGSPEAPEQD